MAKIWDDYSGRFIEVETLNVNGQVVADDSIIDDNLVKVYSEVSQIDSDDIDWFDIPPRQWLVGKRLLLGEVSVLTGAGGVGKSSLTLTIALSLAIGNNLLDLDNSDPAWKLHLDKPVGVHVYNLEDSMDEMKRRVVALLKYHEIPTSYMSGNLFFGDGMTDRLILASLHKDKIVRQPCVEALIEALIAKNIKLLIVDPMLKSHLLHENDNIHMDYVMVTLKYIAQQANCAVWLIHHSGKNALDPTGSRGASSIVAAARVAECLSKPSNEERSNLGLGKDVIKLDRVKENLAVSEDCQWLRIFGQPVGNGDDTYPEGDMGQVIELAHSRDLTEQMNTIVFSGITNNIMAGPPNGEKCWRAMKTSANWIGNAFKDYISDRKLVDSILKHWKETGLIQDCIVPGAQNKGTKGYEINPDKVAEILAQKESVS